MKTKGLIPRIGRFLKKLLLILVIGQFLYILLLKWVNPPITVTQLSNWVSGYGLKRDYVDFEEMSYYAKLAVISSEDQLFADHSGFDWKSIEKAMKYNEKNPTGFGGPVLSVSRLQKMYFYGRAAPGSGKDWKPILPL